MQEIEHKLFGPTGDVQVSLNGNEPVNLINMLIDIDNKLKTLTIGKDRFNQCYNELCKLQKIFSNDEDFQALLSSTVNNNETVKFEEILAFEDKITDDGNMVDAIEKLEPCLELNHIRKVSDLEPMLNSIKLSLFQLRQCSNDIEDELQVMLESYTNWFCFIKQKLEQFNTELTQLEIKKQECKFD